MINIMKLAKEPKDYNDFVARKVSAQPYIVKGLVINKKTNKAYNIDIHMDTEELTQDTKVKVSCSCEDFKFRWAYVLYKEGALLNPNTFVLEPPKKTNPDQIMNDCKHIHAFVKNEMSGKLKTFSARAGSI